MDSNYERARAFFIDGVQHYEAGRYAQAEQKFSAALALMPGRVSALTNLGAARLKLGRMEEALAVLGEALAQEPDNTEALGHRGTALAELGRRDEALAAFDRVLQLQPSQGTAWSHRGTVLRELGRLDEAAASFEKAIAHGADRELNAYYLAALRQGTGTPAAPPRHYVQALFDAYAGQFDAHLVSQLRYDAPQVLVQRVAATGRRFERVLDLGCGTGLCGPLLQPLSDAVDGIDLSANMLDKARGLGVYASLQQAELQQHLQATTQRYDLVIAADVLVYLGDLQPLFAGVARVLQPQGLFCFTAEEAEGGAAYELRPSLRYAHSEPALRALAAQHGFEVLHLEQRPVREDQRVPIAGLFAWLQKV